MGKSELRKEIQEIRDEMPLEIRKRKSTQIIRKLLDTSVYKEADVVLCYVSCKSEVDTFPFLRQVISDGKALYCPRVVGKNMIFLRVFSTEELKEGYMGILEPSLSDAFTPMLGEKKALCIMPGLAFDKQKNRLGYGGGFYDRYLSIHSDFVNTVALAFSEQILEAIPDAKEDVKPEMIITDEDIY